MARILYVEDDLTLAGTVEKMLRAGGHDCNATPLGKEAVEMAKTGAYDLILLDMMLPDIDGYEVVRALRAAGVTTPYLLQTGLVDQDSDIGGLTVGVGEYLSKPFTKAQLLEKVQNTLVRSQIQVISTPDDTLIGRDQPPDGTDERRTHRRFKTMTPARILSGYGIDCKIINMSYGGATIRVEGEMPYYPEVFDVKLRGAATYRCEVRWKEGNLIGVKFIRLKL